MTDTSIPPPLLLDSSLMYLVLAITMPIPSDLTPFLVEFLIVLGFYLKTWVSPPFPPPSDPTTLENII